jgi:hypothetical protein
MAARFYFRDGADDTFEVTGRLSRVGWEVREQAEEGSAAMSTLVFDDPDMDFDIFAHRWCYIIEDTSESDDDVLFGGLIADQEIGREGGDSVEPLGRVWTVSVTDRNALWQRRVMIGTDCNRPAETDVERMQWLFSTTEANWATDPTTYVSTADPVAMDACDYRGQMMNQIVDDCAQASGKNWYCYFARDGGGNLQVVVWYGRDTLAVYDSPLFLSNDPNDWLDAELADGSSLVWPISMDTKLRRDPSRVFSGVYLPYEGGAVYRQSAATWAAFAKRDFIASSLNVKTAAKATARAVRYLAELDEQDETISTTVELPAAKATMLRAGMRVPFRATHLPGFDDGEFHWCRVLSVSITPIAAGTQYRLSLELAPTGATYAGVYPGAAFGALLVSQGWATLGYQTDGDSPANGWYVEPTVGPITPSVAAQTVTVGAPMVVRIEASAWFTTVATDATATIDVCVNGASIGSDTAAYAGAIAGWQDYLTVDLHDVTLAAGDVVTVTASTTGFLTGGWSNDSANTTYLRVGRGTHVWNSGIITWVGP